MDKGFVCDEHLCCHRVSLHHPHRCGSIQHETHDRNHGHGAGSRTHCIDHHLPAGDPPSSGTGGKIKKELPFIGVVVKKDEDMATAKRGIY